MAVANSSPVNPMVFFDVSIGGQVRSGQAPRPSPKRNCTGVAYSESRKVKLDQNLPSSGGRGGGDGAGGGGVLTILASRRCRDWAE